MHNFTITLLWILSCCYVGTALADDQPVDQATCDKALQEMNDTLTKARTVPNFENGQPAGYKVIQPQQEGVDQKLELKNGGVITGINGQPDSTNEDRAPAAQE